MFLPPRAQITPPRLFAAAGAECLKGGWSCGAAAAFASISLSVYPSAAPSTASISPSHPRAREGVRVRDSSPFRADF